MAKNYGEEEEFNIWPTYSDVAFSIVLILLFLMFAQYVVIGKILNIAEIEKTQLLIRSKLQDRFPQEWNVSIRESSQPQLQRITFTDKILFETGSAELGVQGGNILRGVAEVITSVHDSLANHANPHQKKSLFDEIQIQGHTDNAPIGGGLQKKYPTNWELSSARATTVVRFFSDNCHLMSNHQLLLSAQGYAEYNNIADNSSEIGRALNRRIEINIKYPLND
ncbi:MAG TPA: OmpA family protein [bacterium]|nr:OmpA family protein [bacterium]